MEIYKLITITIILIITVHLIGLFSIANSILSRMNPPRTPEIDPEQRIGDMLVGELLTIKKSPALKDLRVILQEENESSGAIFKLSEAGTHIHIERVK